MKKVLFATFAALTLALFSCFEASADVVSLDKATAAARQYFNDGAVTRAGAIEPVLAWTYSEVTKGPYAPAFYVFNNPQGGWMIISGEDACHAILAHSDTGSFDPQTLPENTAWWLGGYAEQIEWARANFLPQDSSTAAEWNDLLSGNIRKAQSTVQLGTPNWNQFAPFNDYCPYYYKNSTFSKCPCGCVATALAEVMYYHSVTRGTGLPQKGNGTVGGYKATKDIYSSDNESSKIVNLEELTLDGAGDYDWNNMKSDYSSYNDSQKEAIAKLIYHCGLISRMQWGEGSSSNGWKAAMGLVRNMGYNPDLYVAYRSAYTESEWILLLKNEIDAHQPIIIGGDGSGGHEFVADGYNENDELWMNWGWSGQYNNWYAVSAFNPSKNYDFRLSISAIIGAYPVAQPTYSPTSPEALRVSNFSMTSDNTATPSGDNPYGNYTVSLGITNRASEAIDGDFRLYVYDYKETRLAVSSTSKRNYTINPSYNQPINNWTGNFRYFNPTYFPPLGAKIRPCYVAAGGDADYSQPILAMETYDGCNNNIPVYDVPFIPVKDYGVYQVGDYFDFVIINSRTAPKDMTVVWTFVGDNVNKTIYPDEKTKQASCRLDTAGTYTIKAVVTIDGVTQTLIQEITVEE